MFRPKVKRTVVFAMAVVAMCFVGAYVAFGIGNGLPPMDWSVPFLSDVLREPDGTVCSTTEPVTMIKGERWAWSNSTTATVSLIATRGLEAPPVDRTYYALSEIAPGTTWGCWHEYTGPIPLPVGKRYKLEFKSVDKEGTYEKHRTAYLGVENEPPVTLCSTDNPAASSWATITLTPTDAMSGVSSDGGTEYILDQTDNPDPFWDTYCGAIVVGTGNHTLRYRSTDRAGNVEATKTITVNVTGTDLIVPTAWIWADNGQLNYQDASGTFGCASSLVTLTLNASTDSAAGILESRYATGDANQFAVGNVYNSDTGIEVSAEGTTTVWYWAKGVNNRESLRKSFKVVIDSAAPQTSDNSTRIYDNYADISLTGTDQGSGTRYVYWRLDGNPAGPPVTELWDVQWEQWDFPLYPGPELTTAVSCETTTGHTLEYFAEDFAGNRSQVVSVSFEVNKSDATSPTAEITMTPAPNANGWYKGPITYSVTAKDNNPNAVAHGSIYGDVYPWGSFPATGTVSLEGTATHNIGIFPPVPGPQWIFYWAKDAARNISALASEPVRIDMYRPAVWSDAAWKEFSYTTTATINLSAYDSGSGVKSMSYRVAKVGSTTSLIASHTVNSDSATLSVKSGSLGKYAITYFAEDNTGRTSATRTTYFYLKAPTVTTVAARSVSGLAYGGPFYIRGTVKFGTKYAAGCTMKLHSSPDAGVTWNEAASTTTDKYGQFTLTAKPTSKTWYKVKCWGSDQFFHSYGSVGTVSPFVFYALPKAYVYNPVAPLTMYRTKAYSVYAYLKPAHPLASYPVRIYKYRYVSGKWVSYGYVNARAYNYSSFTKCIASVKLPYAGKWRLRAYAVADSKHYAAWSSGYDYVMVK